MDLERDMLQQAWKLLLEGNSAESKSLFQKVIAINGKLIADAYYGCGLATRNLGGISEASNCFEQALKIDSRIEGARRALAHLAPPGAYGSYEVLRDDESRLGQDALVLLNDLCRINEVRPSLTAYLSQFLPSLCALLFLGTSLIVVMILFVSDQMLFPLWAIIPIVVLFICGHPIITGIWRFLKVQNTRYSILHGRIYVKVGILGQKIAPFELFRIRYVNLEQSFLNRLTKDGTLVIGIGLENQGETKIIKITGLARGKELHNLHRKLLTLVSLLRFNDRTKGFSGL